VSRESLRSLEHVARLKANLELRRFAALRRHVAAIDARIGALEAELEATAAVWGEAATLAEMRRVNALTRAAVEDREETMALRAKLEPAHEAARQAAAKAFGRAEAMAELARMAEAETRRRRARRLEG